MNFKDKEHQRLVELLTDKIDKNQNNLVELINRDHAQLAELIYNLDTKFDAKFDSLDSRLNEHDKKLNELDGKFDELCAVLAENFSQVATKADIASVRAEIAHMDARLSPIILDHERRIGQLEKAA